MSSEQAITAGAPRRTGSFSARFRMSAPLAFAAGLMLAGVATPAKAGAPEPVPAEAQSKNQAVADPAAAGLRLEPLKPLALLEPPLPTPRIVVARQRLQCVPFARAESGVEIRGDAKTWWSQAAGVYQRQKRPEPGAVIVMKGYNGADRGHVAVVRQVVNDRKIVIDHANWLNRGEITLNVPVQDVSAKGDWSEVRVWHIPRGIWGARVYATQGFILPYRLTASAQLTFEPIS